MPITEEFGVEAPTQKEWLGVPAGVYQVVVKDIDLKDTTKYQSDEKQTQYLFKFVILDGENEANLQILTSFVSRSWFKGNSKKAFNPSKLVTIVEAIYAYYYPDLSVKELEAEDMTPPVINDLIGKQLKVVVKLNEDRNKITEFLQIKAELDVPEEIKIAETKLTAKPAAGLKANKSTKSSEEEKEEVKSDLPF